ncbi:hypothetical protein D3C86_1845820 [compost metagenome]
MVCFPAITFPSKVNQPFSVVTFEVDFSVLFEATFKSFAFFKPLLSVFIGFAFEASAIHSCKLFAVVAAFLVNSAATSKLGLEDGSEPKS